MRCLFTLISALSLLLWLATAVLWVRSYSVAEGWICDGAGNRTSMMSVRGKLQLQELTYPPKEPIPFSSPTGYFRGRAENVRPIRLPPQWQFAGLRWNSTMDGTDSIRFRILYIPDWIVASCSLLLPCLWAFAALRDRRPGHCSACGYDLRATPDRCPECGTPARHPAPNRTAEISN